MNIVSSFVVSDTAMGRDKPSNTAKFPQFSDEYIYDIIKTRFDRVFYEDLCHRDFSKEDPIRHYMDFGYCAGLDPNPHFSTTYYLTKNPDVAESGLNPFFHYLIAGESEGRQAKTDPGSTELNVDIEFAKQMIDPELDKDYYRAQLPRDGDGILDLSAHYLVEGWRAGLDPTRAFSTRYYLETNDDVRRHGINPFLHYIGWGRAEGRRPAPYLAAADRAVTDPPARPEPLEPLLTACDLTALDAASQSSALSKLRSAFDENYYLMMSPDLRGSSIDPFTHYMTYGWKEHRDPSKDFSTKFYLSTYPDVAEAHLNPLTHFVLYGQPEGRKGNSFFRSILARSYSPSVTVVIPNFNHERFLKQRIDSILEQTYQNFTILILDDCSVDNSVDIIRAYADRYPERIRVILNDHNSGNVFAQWKRGFEEAQGDLLWICESDDFCEPDFLERCIQPFRDPSVMISFGRVQFADEDGRAYEGLDQYREQAEPQIWTRATTRFAAEWFCGAFAVSNLIPNVGGCVIRRQRVSANVWNELLKFKISGDWYFYLNLAGGGQISYCPDAISYFRQHTNNTSVLGFNSPEYYKEHERIMRECRSAWGTPDDIAVRMYINLYHHYRQLGAAKAIGALATHYSNDAVLSTPKSRTHVLMCFLGFQLGGGEIFPIHLANELVERGYVVSALCLDTARPDPAVRALLDSRVVVYDAQFAREYGLTSFVKKAGVDVIHTHNAGIEFLFFQTPDFHPEAPYVVTLHGSYEVTPIPDDMMFRVLCGVSHWVYLTPKNLRHLRGLPISKDCLSMIPNGMPVDDREFAFGRRHLGIAKSDLVFVVASRAIREKGWEIAIAALELAQRETEVRLHLVLCGTGPEFDRLSPSYDGNESVHFLGFQDRIPGVYRMGDVALLPTRFPGESHPLGLIQAMQAGRPVIATDIGEIKNMLMNGDACAGITLPFTNDDSSFLRSTVNAMLTMTDKKKRAGYAANAIRIGQDYSITKVASSYCDLYRRVIDGGVSRFPLAPV